MTKPSLILKAVAEFIVVGICTIAFALSGLAICASFLGSNAPGTRDFVEYWAAGQQLVEHHNPYDPETIRKLEDSAGFPKSAPTLIPGNPPSALLLFMPLGFLGATSGEIVWEFLLLASLFASVQLIRVTFGRPKNNIHLLAYAFAPVLTCLLAGQIALFLLLGLALFLRFHPTRPFLAGASLWLCLLKPHLFLPFGIVLLIWIVLHHRYWILAGTGAALAFSSAIATVLNPRIWGQYRYMMGTQRIDQLDLPSISVLIRHFVYPHSFWIQCLPAIIGCVWAISYFVKRRSNWNWTHQGSVLMLVSVAVAPYSWFMDQSVLLPALLCGLYTTRSRTMISILALMSALIEVEAFRGISLYSLFYLWTAPGWVVWYWIATTRRLRQSTHVLEEA
jgi:hypothetical protein